MKDADTKVIADLAGLDKDAWLDRVETLTDELGYFEPLGDAHAAAFIDAGKKLFVTFENVAAICDQGGKAEPVGFDYVRHDGWSHLAILSYDESWYRDRAVYGYFDRLIDDGFFEDFDQVLFYGAGAGGYAAAAFSVAAPNCTVLAIRPQATLDPSVTGFDQRFRDQRRSDFTSRYGYAPDMIDAVNTAYIAFDPIQRFDAIHAALFTRKNMIPLRCTHLGSRLEQTLAQMEVLPALIRAAMSRKLTRSAFNKLMRVRRDSMTFQRNVLRFARREGHGKLAANYCAAILRRGADPYIAKQLEELIAEGHARPGQRATQAAE